MVYLLLTYNLFHIAGLSVAAIHAKAEGARPKPGPSTPHEQPRRTELAIFLKPSVQFLPSLSCRESRRTSAPAGPYVSDQIVDGFADAGESRAKHLLLTFPVDIVVGAIIERVGAKLWNQPFRSDLWL
jgi:hypothetical protein